MKREQLASGYFVVRQSAGEKAEQYRVTPEFIAGLRRIADDDPRLEEILRRYEQW